ncbi:MAG: glutamate-5-semialdehyde dehydrogenase [Planctomycetota bacterium]
MQRIEQAAREAKTASRTLAALDTRTKNAVLIGVAAAIAARTGEVLAANREDVRTAEADGVGGPKLDRLGLTEAKLADMVSGIRQIVAMDDPVGRVSRSWTTAEGLDVAKVRTPLGVIAMIYEARPGVTVDAFVLCFKAGNACVLKGGREAARTNACLCEIVRTVLRGHGVPEAAMTAVTTSNRDELGHMLTLTGSIDLVIPRGGAGLIGFVAERSRVPTVQHFHGVCHCYVDSQADLDRAIEIVMNGKTSMPAACNALECVLVHRDVAAEFVPALAERCARAGVEIRGDERFGAHAGDASGIVRAGEDDFGTEFLDLVLAAKVVDSLGDAMQHIARHASDHTETIVTEDAETAERFLREVTSSCVLVNASTRFNDGFSLGLGAEIGISTSKVHAYGPMGLEELTAERYVVRGRGQVR